MGSRGRKSRPGGRVGEGAEKAGRAGGENYRAAYAKTLLREGGSVRSQCGENRGVKGCVLGEGRDVGGSCRAELGHGKDTADDSGRMKGR
jgi:hypothetical protein